MSLDRPLLLSGWDPHGRFLRPQRYRDHETAQHVAHVLRACGFRITLVPTAPHDTEHDGERASRAPLTTADPAPAALRTLEDVDRSHIIAVLHETGGTVEGPKGAARILKLDRNTLRHRMRKLGIKPGAHRQL